MPAGKKRSSIEGGKKTAEAENNPKKQKTLKTEKAEPTATKESEETSVRKEEEKKISGTNTKEKTPWQQFSDRVDEVMKRNNCEGCILIRGIPRKSKDDEDDEDDEEDEEEDDEDEEEDKENKNETSKDKKDSYTPEQVDSIRYVLVTKERGKQLEQAEKGLLREDYGQPFLMFCGSDRWAMLAYIQKELAKIQRQKNLKKKFDNLFAVTNMGLEYEMWIGHDIEGEVCGLMMKLWKALLRHTDEELGIDPEFTRPGVIAMIEDAKKTFESHEIHVNYD